MQGIIVVCKNNKNMYYIIYVVFSVQNVTKKKTLFYDENKYVG